MTKTPDLLLNKDIHTNFLINGNMDFWQRSDSIVFNSTSGYGMDRWFVNSVNSLTIEPNSVGAPVGSTNYQSMIFNNSQGLIAQVMEERNAVNLAGEDFIFTCLMRRTAAMANGEVQINLSSNPTGDQSLLSAGWVTIDQLDIPINEVPLSTNSSSDWVRFSVRGKMPVDHKGLYVSINTSALNPAGAQLDISQAQIRLGQEPLTFVTAGKSFAAEYELCKRYFQKSWRLRTNVGAATTTGRKIRTHFQNSSSTALETTWDLDTAMRVESPAIVTYNSNGGIGVLTYISRTTSNSNHSGISITRHTESSFNMELTGISGGGRGDAVSVLAHYTADAEI